ncbi:hypothetical protein SS50377_22446 [Spironucleus salmonicida]|uniref:Uncharacterized protein n=1 Tax=Spironucleus salmonicida TaxID=348837 RepID=V6LCT3_9EUKA|nr:hypothetical protein SS50377_22446 [Spironucleus salmonicida]|eukprot:EST42063.1 Hypothetical protein SS50377_18370 [Spironucleus salmonicida]
MIGVFKIVSFNYQTNNDFQQVKAVFQDKIFGIKGYFKLENTAISLDEATLQKTSYFLNKKSKYTFIKQNLTENDIAVYFKLNCRDFTAENFLGTIIQAQLIPNQTYQVTLQTPFNLTLDITLQNAQNIIQKKAFALKMVNSDQLTFLNEPQQIQFVTPQTALILAKLCNFNATLVNNCLKFAQSNYQHPIQALPIGEPPQLQFPVVQSQNIDFGPQTMRLVGDFYIENCIVCVKKNIFACTLPRVKYGYLGLIQNITQILGPQIAFNQQVVILIPHVVLSSFIFRFLGKLFVKEGDIDFDIFGALQIKPVELLFQKQFKKLTFDCLIIDDIIVVGKIILTQESLI